MLESYGTSDRRAGLAKPRRNERREKSIACFRHLRTSDLRCQLLLSRYIIDAFKDMLKARWRLERCIELMVLEDRALEKGSGSREGCSWLGFVCLAILKMFMHNHVGIKKGGNIDR